MKKNIFLSICAISLVVLTSCGSTAPCGLAEKTNSIKEINKQEVVLVAEAK